MKKIYIHIGPWKSGTTALQRALGENVKKLFEHGFDYPNGTGGEKIQSGNIIGRANKCPDALIEYLRIAIEESVSNNVIFSNEVILGLIIGESVVFRRLSELGSELNCKFYLVLTIRSFAERLQSVYAQKIKQHGYSQSYDSYLLETPLFQNFLDILNNSISSGIEVLTHEYSKDREFYSGFVSALGIPCSISPQTPSIITRSLLSNEVYVQQAMMAFAKGDDIKRLGWAMVENSSQLYPKHIFKASNEIANQLLEKANPLIEEINSKLPGPHTFSLLKLSDFDSGDDYIPFTDKQLETIKIWHEERFIRKSEIRGYVINWLKRKILMR